MDAVHFSKPSRIVIVCTAVVILTIGLRQLQDIITPVLLALFVTQAFGPIAYFLIRHRVPRSAAFILVLVLIVAVGVLVLTIMGGSLSQVDSKLPTYQENIQTYTADIQAFLARFGIDPSSATVSGENVVEYGGTIISAMLSTLGNISLVFFVAAFMLFEATGFMSKITRALGPTNSFQKAAVNYTGDIRNYAFIKAWLGGLVAIVETIVMLIIGVDFAVLWGMLSFFMSFIPNVGFIISLIPPVFFALLEFGWEEAAIVLAMYLVINTAVDNVVSPRYMGRGLNLSPLVVFLSLMYWGYVFGMVGAFLSVPLTLMVKLLLLERYEEARWLAVVMEPAHGEETLPVGSDAALGAAALGSASTSDAE